MIILKFLLITLFIIPFIWILHVFIVCRIKYKKHGFRLYRIKNNSQVECLNKKRIKINNDDNNLVIFIKSYIKDLDRLKILKDSIDKYNADKIPVYISVPKKDIEIMKREIVTGKENYSINFVMDEEVMSFIYTEEIFPQNWWTQQMVKLCFYKLNLCNFYAIIDSDAYFFDNFYITDFLYKKDIPYLFTQDHNVINDFDANFSNISSIFKTTGAPMNYIFDGQVFSKKVLTSLEKYLETKNLDFVKLINIYPSEFTLYGEYLTKTHIFNYVPASTLIPFIGDEFSYFTYKYIYGNTIEDFKRDGKKGAKLNNRWVKDKTYKPAKFVKLIKLIRKIYELYNYED